MELVKKGELCHTMTRQYSSTIAGMVVKKRINRRLIVNRSG